MTDIHTHSTVSEFKTSVSHHPPITMNDILLLFAQDSNFIRLLFQGLMILKQFVYLLKMF